MLKKIQDVRDMLHIKQLVQQYSTVDYITASYVERDFARQELFSWEIEGEVLGIASLVWDDTFKMHYIKRLLVFQQNKGVAKALLRELSIMAKSVAITPFPDNHTMLHIIIQLGFTYMYTFQGVYMLHIKHN